RPAAEVGLPYELEIVIGGDVALQRDLVPRTADHGRIDLVVRAQDLPQRETGIEIDIEMDEIFLRSGNGRHHRRIAGHVARTDGHRKTQPECAILEVDV